MVGVCPNCKSKHLQVIERPLGQNIFNISIRCLSCGYSRTGNVRAR